MTIGKISEFDIHKDDWKLYIERVEQYFIVNEIPNERRVPTLITVMGAESYELLVNLCTPARPVTKTFQQIAEIMEQHLQPKPSELAERYKFRQRIQKSSEKIADYVAVLKKMSKTCVFGIGLEENLRDQMVCGISSEIIRQRLFAESNLNFTRAYSLAVSLESAEKDAAVVEGHARSISDTKMAQCHSMSETKWRDNQRAMGAKACMQQGGNVSTAREANQRGPQRKQAERVVPAVQRSERVQRQYLQCRACGGSHHVSSCRFARYVCRACNKMGHLRRVCPNLTEQHCVEAADVDGMREVHSDNSDEVIEFFINKLTVGQCKPIIVTLNVHNRNIDMECDTGSAISCISYDSYRRQFSDLPIYSCNLMLRYYTGEVVRPIGCIKPNVTYNNCEKNLDLYVIENGKTALLGRQWIAELNIGLPPLGYREFSLNVLQNEEFNLAAFSSRFCEVFADGLGRFTGPPVTIHVREGARPVFMRARPLAYALRGPVERALDQLQRDGILTPVERSSWATPIVPVVKKDGNIRICADYKLTLNKVIEIDRYPLPRIDDLLVRLEGGQRFSKIDLSQAYAQLVLDESKKYTVINTHKGLFMYNRLVYGLASSPGVFQRRLEELFSDMPQVGIFLDDIIITGRSTQEHIDNLYRVFERLEKYGLRIKKEKCDFFAESVTFLGHIISKEGVHTCPDKIKAIVNTPAPTNVSELRSFLGMVMYYSKFVKDISTILAPLYELLKAGSKFIWTAGCKHAFELIKNKMTSSDVLIHYSSELPLVLTADASSVGIGAVLAHVTPDGERPVAYASRSLTSAERHYSQIDREALAIVYGIRKYHQYLYGRRFILRTDHKPLTYIFGEKVGIPVMAASRLQRWAVLLSGYTYDIEYVASKKNCADALSRLPAKSDDVRNTAREITYSNFVENFLPVTNDDVRRATAKDILLSRIKVYIESGWPHSCPDEYIKPYFVRRNELYVENGCVMWGYRMVLPESLRGMILQQLHSSHMGMVKMKGMARSYVWWPLIDGDIEKLCRECETCALEAAAPPRSAPRPWPYHTQPWSRLHIDFLGPYKGRSFLVLIDSTSKWLEVSEMKQTNAAAVIKVLRSIFARFGLPVELVSDQGPPFTSAEFSNFLKINGIHQLFSPAYHPASNGAAENAVKLCKRAVKKALRDNVDVDAALQTFLLNYRNTVHSTTGESPAMLLQKRGLRSRLDLLRNDRLIIDRVRKCQNRQVENAGGVQREFNDGDKVWARGYGSQDKWVSSKVANREGSRQYVLDSGNGQFLKRHIDQIRRRSRLSDVPCPVTAADEEGMVTRNCEDAASPPPVEVVVVDGDADANGSGLQQHSKSVHVGVAEGPAGASKETPILSACQPSPPQIPVISPRRRRKPVVRYGLEFD